jgi:hypothetical protein
MTSAATAASFRRRPAAPWIQPAPRTPRTPTGWRLRRTVTICVVSIRSAASASTSFIQRNATSTRSPRSSCAGAPWIYPRLTASSPTSSPTPCTTQPSVRARRSSSAACWAYPGSRSLPERNPAGSTLPPEVLRFKSSAELSAQGDDTWAQMLGSPGVPWRAASGTREEVLSVPRIPPALPQMVESELPRAGVAPGNPINGDEFDTAIRVGGGGDNTSPVCEATPGVSSAGTNQYWGKAYPGLRQLQVLKELGETPWSAPLARATPPTPSPPTMSTAPRSALCSHACKPPESQGPERNGEPRAGKTRGLGTRAVRLRPHAPQPSAGVGARQRFDGARVLQRADAHREIEPRGHQRGDLIAELNAERGARVLLQETRQERRDVLVPQILRHAEAQRTRDLAAMPSAVSVLLVLVGAVRGEGSATRLSVRWAQLARRVKGLRGIDEGAVETLSSVQ